MKLPNTVVIGLGSGGRRDDGIGPAVVSRIADLELPGVSVSVSEGDPARILDLWAAADLAVVVDAVTGVLPSPGQVRRFEARGLGDGFARTSSHSFGIEQAVALGRALDRLPVRLVIIAVEAQCLDLGIGLSGRVAAAIPDAVAALLDEVCGSAAGTSGHKARPDDDFLL